MQLLEDRIKRDGVILEGDVLKVDSFLNHQMDIVLLEEIGKEFLRLYRGCNINKILTIEASGIGMACLAAQAFRCPLLFAKKSKTSNIADDLYRVKVKSYTHGTTSEVIVSKKYLTPDDNVLIIDDFLATGEALDGLIGLVRQAGANLVGAGVAIEKAYQSGGDRIRATGVRVEALARIKSMSPENGVKFC